MLHNLGSLGALIDQLTRCHNTNRAVRDEVSPHPMVMSDCGGCIEMGPIVQCVTVANNNERGNLRCEVLRRPSYFRI
jgi:hypothetical protein